MAVAEQNIDIKQKNPELISTPIAHPEQFYNHPQLPTQQQELHILGHDKIAVGETELTLSERERFALNALLFTRGRWISPRDIAPDVIPSEKRIKDITQTLSLSFKKLHNQLNTDDRAFVLTGKSGKRSTFSLSPNVHVVDFRPYQDVIEPATDFKLYAVKDEPKRKKRTFSVGFRAYQALDALLLYSEDGVITYEKSAGLKIKQLMNAHEADSPTFQTSIRKLDGAGYIVHDIEQKTLSLTKAGREYILRTKEQPFTIPKRKEEVLKDDAAYKIIDFIMEKTNERIGSLTDDELAKDGPWLLAKDCPNKVSALIANELKLPVDSVSRELYRLVKQKRYLEVEYSFIKGADGKVARIISNVRVFASGKQYAERVYAKVSQEQGIIQPDLADEITNLQIACLNLANEVGELATKKEILRLTDIGLESGQTNVEAKQLCKMLHEIFRNLKSNLVYKKRPPVKAAL